MKIKAIKAEVIERIKREWQEHNRDYGLTWNEVATLVNQVSRHHTQTSRPSVEEANKIVEENFKGLNDLIEDADFLQFYKSLISDCMVDFAKHHAPTDQCENEPDWNCPKCGFIYTSKVTSDGHCKNCSEQVTQRSHTPTERPSAEDILKQVLEIADYTQELNMANYDHNQVNDLNNAIIEICQLLQHHTPISRPSEEESKEDFLDWLQWKDKLPEEEDPDYYTVTWGMNVWNNAMKFYNK